MNFLHAINVEIIDIDRKIVNYSKFIQMLEILTNLTSDRSLAGLRPLPALPGERLLLRPGESAAAAGEGGQGRLCGLSPVAARSPVRPGRGVHQDRRQSPAGSGIKVSGTTRDKILNSRRSPCSPTCNGSL